jgi:hypothetical protein
VLEAARAAVARLAEQDIPHLIIGGIAVQEHGYPRVTIDVDIVFPANFPWRGWCSNFIWKRGTRFRRKSNWPASFLRSMRFRF